MRSTKNDAEVSGTSTRNPLRYPRRGGGDLLQTAATLLGREESADRQEPWTEARFELETRQQLERLTEWAEPLGLFIDLKDYGRLHRGRREHDTIGEGDEDWIFKITRGSGFGLVPSSRNVVSGMVSDWFAVFPATPAQYFERLLLSNLIYPGLNSLEGFCHIDDRFVIVTSQPFIAGRNATPVEIRRFLAPQGFVKLCDATWYRDSDGLALFDVGGSNLFCDENGTLIPIDIIPIQPTGPLADTVKRAFARISS
ncbi:MAG: hypothetical protein AAF226_06965 [Verrucomicrobiota bacterium]